MITPETIVKERMYKNDAFSQWLGVEIQEVGEGYCRANMVVRDEMLNGFNIAHGGITYSFADSAFAFASNSFGKYAVSIDTSISHTSKVVAGDRLVAIARVLYRGRKTAVYEVKVKNKKDVVAVFKGTVFHKDKDWV